MTNQALADAMLAGPPTEESCVRRCQKALDARPRGLRKVVRAALARFGNAWHDGSRDKLAWFLRSQGVRHVVRRFVLKTPAAPPALAAVPPLPTVGDLASWLELSVDELLVYARRWRGGSRHYHVREVRKRTTGVRLLEIPKSRLRALQRRVLHGLLDLVPCHPAAHGFLKGRSIVTGAQGHVGQTIVVSMDLRDFFESVSRNRVLGLFLTLGYPRAVARALSALCSSPRGCLPQGAPTSPALANLCAFGLDVRLAGLARSLGATYTRYADDLTFSGSRGLADLSVLVDVIAREEGFALNHRKTEVMRRARCQQVTGVVVNERVNWRRDDWDALKATLWNCVRFGPAGQNREEVPDFRAHLRGRVAHAVHLNPQRGARLLALWEEVPW